MKTQKTLTAALAAFAGLSLATVYAAPSYTPNTDSPINATPLLNSASSNLNTYDDYIGLVQAQLTGGQSLVLPTPSGSTFPDSKSFIAAVDAAVGAAATPADVQNIVAAATQYLASNYGNKVKDILKSIATDHPDSAEDAVIGAVTGNPGRAADAAAGAIQGVIASANEAGANFGDIADETITDKTHTLVEKIAKAAVSSTKKAASPTRAAEVAVALTQAVIGDGVKLYIDDLARGITAGAKGIAGTSQGEVAAAALAALDGTPYENLTYVSEFVSGALRALVIGKPNNPSGDYSAVLAALKTEPTVGAGFADDIDAISAAHINLRNAPGGGGEVPAFLTGLNAGSNSSHLEAYMIGAMQNKSAKAADFITAMFNDPMVGSPTSAVKQAVVGAAVRGKFSGAGKVTTAAINSAANSLTRTLTIQAAIPNAPLEYAGVITSAAVKTGDATSDTGTVSDSQPDDIANAALSAAVAAGYQRAINDIALQAAKARKSDAPNIVQTLITNPASAGWREAIVAEAVINDSKNLGAIKAGADLGASAAGSSDFEKASIDLAAGLAQNAKANNKTAFDDAIEDFYGADVDVNGTPTPATQFAKAILFGRGPVNIKNAGPLLAIAMKYKTGSTTNAQLLDIAKALYKKNASVLDVQYAVIQDALSTPDALFDMVDHEVFTHAAKIAPDIAAAAVAARPEYAHFVARAGAFRAPGSAGKIGAAAITYGHMKSNRDATGAPITDPNDPAAVAAISSATVLGVLDAKLIATKETSAIKNAAASLVKAAAALTDENDSDFRQSDGGSGTFTPVQASGTGGAVTGLVAQLEGYGGDSVSALGSLATTAITAAAKADKKHLLVIAQAAAQTAQWIYQLDGNSLTIDAAFKAAIVAAVQAGGGGDATALANAVDFGVSEAFVNNNYPQGAAGLLNLQHRSGTGSPVTDISNF